MDILPHVLELLFPLKKMMKQGSLLVN